MRSFLPSFVVARVAWLIVMALAVRASATEGPELSWLAPDECPGPEALRGGVEQLLARPWGELESELSIEARLERVDELWRLELLVSRDGEALPPRRVDGESCAALVEAAAAIVALIIEQELVPAEVEEPAPDAEHPTSTDSETSPKPSPPEPKSEPNSHVADVLPPVAPPRAQRRLRGGGELAGILDVGSLPRASVGGRLGAGIDWRAWRVTLDGVGLAPVRWSLRLGEGKYGTFWLVGAQLRGCHVLGIGRRPVQLASCGAFEGDWLQASTHGVSNEDSGGLPVWSLGPELAVLVGRNSPHRLQLGTGIQFPLLRRQLFVEDATNGWTIGKPYRVQQATLRLVVGYRLDP